MRINGPIPLTQSQYKRRASCALCSQGFSTDRRRMQPAREMVYNCDMTNPDPISVLRAALADDRRNLREAVDLVPPERRRERPGEGQWSVAEVLEHLA